jgi:hypothetical protein
MADLAKIPPAPDNPALLLNATSGGESRNGQAFDLVIPLISGT